MCANVSDLYARLRPARIVLAYSGGRDSSVLLHLLRHLYPAAGVRAAPRLLAVHVHHGLCGEADAWQRHCRERAQSLGVDMVAVRATVAPRGASPEAAARTARYAALRRCAAPGTLLLTAHHRDDQAETVLLQMLRGAGPAGLAAMPECAPFGGGWLARPMLSCARAEIHDYALRHALRWVEDPTNDYARYDRNYLRHRVAPLLRARWPKWDATVARGARHQAEARALLEAEAERLLARCTLPGESELLIGACASLSAARQRLVLRRWLQTCGLRSPSERRLEYLRATLIVSRPRSGVVVAWPGVDIGCYRGKLYTCARAAEAGALPAETAWLPGADLELPRLQRTLRWRDLLRQAPALADAGDLCVRFRRGGERCRRGSRGRCFHQDLGKIFQAHCVPPWRRGQVPLIHAAGRLRLVWGVTACD